MSRYIKYKHTTAMVCIGALSLGSCNHNQDYLNVNQSELLKSKLANPDKELKLEESVQIFKECIDLGKEPAENAKGKDIVAFIGNTGSGKSTTINWLNGCDLAEKKMNGVKILYVKEDSKCPPIMEIGHTKTSMTFMPMVGIGNNGFTYLDCPGFLDNRGGEINISNAVNIKNTIKQAKSIRIMVLLDYRNMQADRANGLKDTIKIASALFGSTENLIQNQKSILIGITKIRKGNNDFDNFNDLVDNFKSCGEETGKLANRLVTFDPLNDPLEGGLNREELIQALKNIEPLKCDGNFFSTILVPSDEKKLVDISEKIALNIKVAIDKNLNTIKPKDFAEATKQLSYLKSLGIIEHKKVEELLIANSSIVINKLHQIEAEFKKRSSEEKFDQASDLFKLLEDSMKHFEEDIRKTIDLKSFSAYKDKCVKTKIDRERRKKEQVLIAEFKEECNREKFKEADSVIKALELIVKDLKGDEKKEVDFKKLQEYKEECIAKKAERERKEAEAEAERKRLVAAQEKQAREMEQMRRDHEAQIAKLTAELQKANECQSWNRQVISGIQSVLDGSLPKHSSNLCSDLESALSCVKSDSSYVAFYCGFNTYSETVFYNPLYWPTESFVKSSYTISIRDIDNYGKSWGAGSWRIGESGYSDDYYKYCYGKGSDNVSTRSYY